MDEVREKLTELLSDFFHIGGDCYTYDLERHKSAFEVGTMTTDDFQEWSSDDVAELAAHLIANGVTIQRWIPVTERLPDAELEALRKGGDKYGGVAVLAVSPHIKRVFEVLYRRTIDGRPVFYIYDSESDGHFTRIVTHWMPLPQAPGKEGTE